ncbi:hypothetical protein [Microcella sp.]|uniref:hypothetical protein n=1 Tax=Microcella sp. TaxID=1913979 RepID=UPI00299F5E49|nr:hypothetical protein [Microcella sp.]MDX2026616.1 hypothetical protein [Microcella sp.]
MTATSALTARRQRLAASWVVAGVSTLVAAMFHTAAGGATPSLVAITAALLLSGGFGMLIVGRRLSRRRTAAGVVLDQVMFHGMFAFFGASAPASTPDLTHSTTAHAHDPLLGFAVDASVATVAPAAAMIAGHLAAAIVAYALLRTGLTAVAACLAALVAALARVVEGYLAPAVPTVARLVARGQHPEALRGTDALRIPDRRGPPVVAVA